MGWKNQGTSCRKGDMGMGQQINMSNGAGCGLVSVNSWNGKVVGGQRTLRTPVQNHRVNRVYAL